MLVGFVETKNFYIFYSYTYYLAGYKYININFFIISKEIWLRIFFGCSYAGRGKIYNIFSSRDRLGIRYTMYININFLFPRNKINSEASQGRGVKFLIFFLRDSRVVPDIRPFYIRFHLPDIRLKCWTNDANFEWANFFFRTFSQV